MLKKLFYKLAARDDSNKTTKKEKTPMLKIVKLFTSQGKLLNTYEGVYLEHWDSNVYFIYTKKCGELIARIDKGANMLLVSENIDK